MKKNRFQLIIMLFAVIISSSFNSCKKFIDVDAPITNVNAENVYKTDANAIAVLTGIYINFSKDNKNANVEGSGITLMSFYPGLSSDELILFSGSSDVTLTAYYQNALTSLNTGATDFWENIYAYVYTTNAAIEGLNETQSLTPAVKSQLLGEAHFLRAFCYFYLTNLYGTVPLITSTDYKVNAALPRVESAKIYELIKSDLKTAQGLLNDHYLDNTLLKSSEERIRPNKYAATALLARAYLYTGDYYNAETEATKVIDNSELYQPVALEDVFLKNSKETIWGIQPVGVESNANTGEGKLFILPSTGPDGSTYPVSLSDKLIESFEANDPRLSAWTGNVTSEGVKYYYANKYKAGGDISQTVEYEIVLRLAEQYLIRAEARAKQNNISGAIADINVIRTRARGAENDTVLPDRVASLNQTEVLSEIIHERQIELFTEWSHRWLDLKRTNTIDEVMKTYITGKGGVWKSTSKNYPIRLEELQKGINLTQTPGY